MQHFSIILDSTSWAFLVAPDLFGHAHGQLSLS
jgi:hypothetical protein